MEILVWGDKMKRQISIYIFLAIVVILLALLYIKFSNDTQLNDNGVLTEEKNNEEQSLEISQEYISYQFYIKDDNGRLVVYEVKTQEIFTQTAIQTKMLPIEIQQELSVGIYFKTESELYNFLESYSS